MKRAAADCAANRLSFDYILNKVFTWNTRNLVFNFPVYMSLCPVVLIPQPLSCSFLYQQQMFRNLDNVFSCDSILVSPGSLNQVFTCATHNRDTSKTWSWAGHPRESKRTHWKKKINDKNDNKTKSFVVGMRHSAAHSPITEENTAAAPVEGRRVLSIHSHCFYCCPLL